MDISFDKEVEWILGRPNFWCSGIARALRKNGYDIKENAESEQAFVIYWMLKLYLEHGMNWREEGYRLLRNNYG